MEPSSTVSFVDVDNVTVENSEEKQAMLSYDKYRKGYLSMTDTDDQDKDKAHHGPCSGDRDDDDDDDEEEEEEEEEEAQDDDDEVTTQSETLFMDDDEHQATMLKLYYPKHLAHTKPKYKYNYSKTDKSISPDLLRLSDSAAVVPPPTHNNSNNNVDGGGKPALPRLCDQPSASLNVRPHIVDNVSESRTSFNFHQIAIPESTTKLKMDMFDKSPPKTDDDDDVDDDGNSTSDKFVTGFIADDHTTQNTNTITVTNTHTTNTTRTTSHQPSDNHIAEVDMMEEHSHTQTHAHSHGTQHCKSKKRSKKQKQKQAARDTKVQPVTQAHKHQKKKKKKKRRKTTTAMDDGHSNGNTNTSKSKSKPSVTISITRTNSHGSSSFAQSLRHQANSPVAFDDGDQDACDQHPCLASSVSVSDRGHDPDHEEDDVEQDKQRQEHDEADAQRPVPIIRRVHDSNQAPPPLRSNKHRRTATHSVIDTSVGNVSRLFVNHHRHHQHEAEPRRGLSISISESDQQSDDRSTQAPQPPPGHARNNRVAVEQQRSRYFHSSKHDKVGANLIPQPRASQVEKTTRRTRLALSSNSEFDEDDDGEDVSRTTRSPIKKMPYLRHNSDKVHTRPRDVSNDVYPRDYNEDDDDDDDDDDDYYDQLQQLQHPRQSLHRTPHMTRAKSQNSSSISYQYGAKSRTERYIEADPPPIHSYNHCVEDDEEDAHNMMTMMTHRQFADTAVMGDDVDVDDDEDADDENYARMMADKYAPFLRSRMSKADMHHLGQVVDHFWHVMDIASNRKIPFEIVKISLRVKSIVIRENHWDILLNELTNFQPSKNITVDMFKDFLFRSRRSNQHAPQYYGDEHIVGALRRKLIVGLLETADHHHQQRGNKPAMARSRSRAGSRPNAKNKLKPKSSVSSKAKLKAFKNRANTNTNTITTTNTTKNKHKSKSKSKPTTLTSGDSYGYGGEDCGIPIETVRFATVGSPIAETETSSKKTMKIKSKPKKTKSSKMKSKTKSGSKPNPNTNTNMNLVPSSRGTRQHHQRSVSGMAMDSVGPMDGDGEGDGEFGGREFSELIQDIDRKRKRVHDPQAQPNYGGGAANSSYPYLHENPTSAKMRPRDSYGGRMRSSSHHSYLQSSSLSTTDSAVDFVVYSQHHPQHQKPAPAPTLSSKHSNASSSKSNRSLQSNQSYLRFSLQHSVISSLLKCYDNSLLKISGSRLMSYLNHNEWRKAIKYLLRSHFAYITDDHNMFSVEQFKFALYDQCDIQYKFGNEILPIMTLSSDQYTQYVITEHSYIDWMMKYIDQMIQLRLHQSFKDEEIEKLLTIVCYKQQHSSRVHQPQAQPQLQHRPKPPQLKKTFENPFFAIGTAATPRNLNATKSNDLHLKLSKAKSVNQVKYAAEPIYMEPSFPRTAYLRPMDSNQSNVSGHRQNYSTSQIAYKPPPPTHKYMYHHYK